MRGLARIAPYHRGSPALAQAPAVWLHARDGWRRRFAILERRPHKRVLLVRFEGIESLDALQPWLGSEVELEREDLPAVGAGEIYAFEALGLRVVTTAGEEIGQVRETLGLPANDVWVVERPDGSEALIPVVGAVVREIDLRRGIATISPLPGLLDG